MKRVSYIKGSGNQKSKQTQSVYASYLPSLTPTLSLDKPNSRSVMFLVYLLLCQRMKLCLIPKPCLSMFCLQAKKAISILSMS